VDDILTHIRRIGAVLRMLLVGLFAFILAALTYSSRGSDSGAVHFVLYGLVGFVPPLLSCWLVNRYVDEPQPAAAAT